MRKVSLGVLVCLLFLSLCLGQTNYGRLQGWCEQGGQKVTTSAAESAHTYMRSYGGCTVTIYNAGTVTPASIFTTAGGTSPKANPFTASSTGLWWFYAADGRYDVRLSGGGIATPFTLGDMTLSAANTSVELSGKANARTYGAIGDGVVDDRAALNTLANTTLAGSGTIYFPDGTYLVNTSMTFPAGVALEFARGAKLSIASGQTVTILGPQNDLLAQRFTGSGTVSFAGNKALREVYPQWWGATGDGTTGNTAAFTATCVAAQTASAPVFVPPGTYNLTGWAPSFTDRITIIGNDPKDTILNGGGTAQISTSSGIITYNLQFANWVNALEVSPGVSGISRVEVRNCIFDTVGNAIYSPVSTNTISSIIFTENEIRDSWAGVTVLCRVAHALVNNNDIHDLQGTVTSGGCIGIWIGNNNWAGQGDYVITGNRINGIVGIDTTDPEVHGIMAQGRRVVISHNIVTGVTSAGTADCESIYVKAVYATVAENQALDHDGDGDGMITVKSSGDGVAAIIKGNTVISSTTQSINGIYHSGQNGTISDNYIDVRVADGQGIVYFDWDVTSAAVIKGNHLICPYRCVTVDGPADFLLQGNVIRNVTVAADSAVRTASTQGKILENLTVIGNHFITVTTNGDVYLPDTPTGTVKYANNVGLVTENSGTATVASGDTYVTIAHGLDLIPTADDISVTPTNNLGNSNKFWLALVNESTFTIYVDVAPGAGTATFAWSAKIH